jgi:hypothetical protein
MKNLNKLTFIFVLFFGFSLFAQEEKPAAPTATQEAMLALAKASQNPVADMTSIPLQFNWYSGGGLGTETMSITNLQPVIPMPISDKWNVVSRTIVPIVSMPSAGGERSKGIADIQEQIFFSPSQPKKLIWGFGPILSLPTATVSELTTGQFGIGPSAVLLVMPGKFVLGGVINNLFRFAGNDETTPINNFFAQPFINYNLKKGWALATAPAITANWEAESDQQWTVPVGMGITKIAMIGKQALSVSMQYYHNAIRPDNAGADLVRMQVAFLFPK